MVLAGFRTSQEPQADGLRLGMTVGRVWEKQPERGEIAMQKALTTLAAVAAVAGLAACGQTTSDRALSGAGIGAGTGAAVGAITGGSPLTGALIGGAVGAAGGALTSPEDIDLGRPLWRR
jgi:hypothetical protein